MQAGTQSARECVDTGALAAGHGRWAETARLEAQGSQQLWVGISSFLAVNSVLPCVSDPGGRGGGFLCFFFLSSPAYSPLETCHLAFKT